MIGISNVTKSNNNTSSKWFSINWADATSKYIGKTLKYYNGSGFTDLTIKHEYDSTRGTYIIQTGYCFVIESDLVLEPKHWYVLYKNSTTASLRRPDVGWPMVKLYYEGPSDTDYTVSYVLKLAFSNSCPSDQMIVTSGTIPEQFNLTPDSHIHVHNGKLLISSNIKPDDGSSFGRFYSASEVISLNGFVCGEMYA